MAEDLGTGFINILPRSLAFGPQLIAKIRPALDAVERASGLTFSGLEVAGIAAFTGVAAASIKLATTFESSMAKIQGLVGLTSEETAQLGNQILDLATQVPVAPNELAQAAFFIESAGFRGAQAMDILRASSEAAAAGLGDTKTVADAVTSAMNSYAQSGLTATHATDVLIAAVREGKLEPATLAQNLGQVLPIAAEVGVSFDQVAAAIAASTREGLQASRAATGVRYLLASFIRPSSQAEEALAGVGISLDGLSRSLANRGLLPTLQTLAQRFDLSTAAGRQLFSTVVGGVRGMSTAAILVGQNGKAVQQIFSNVENSAGSLANAFNVASGTMGFSTRQLFSDVQVLGIEFGRELLPVAKDVVGVLKLVALVIRPIIGSSRELIAVLGGYYVIGKIATVMQHFGVATEEAAAALTAETEAAAGGVGANEALAAAETDASIAAGELAATTEAAGSRIASAGTSLAAMRGPLIAIAAGLFAFHKEAQVVLQSAGDLANQFHITEDAAASLQSRTRAQPELGGTGGFLHSAADFFGQFGAATNEASDAYSQVAQQALAAGVSQETLNLALQRALPTLNANRASIGPFIDQLKGYIVSENSVAAAREKSTVAANKETAAMILTGNAAGSLNRAFDASPHGIHPTTDALNQNADAADRVRAAYSQLSPQAQLLIDYGRQIVSGYKTVGPLFDAMGISMESFRQQAADALATGKFDAFSKDIKTKAADAISQFAQSASQNLSAVDADFTQLGEHASASALVAGLGKARADTQKFAGDLKELGNVLHGQGRALASYLLTTGDAAHAATLAAASPQLQRMAVRNFNSQQNAVTSLSSALTKQLLPTLQDMNKLLEAIAGQYNISMNLNDNVTPDLNAIKVKLTEIGGHPYYVDIYGHYHAPVMPGSSPTGPYAEGGIMAGQTGFITRRPALIGEGTYPTPAGRGSEAVIPLNARGAQFMRRAWGMDYGQAPAPAMSLSGTISGGLRIHDWRNGLASLDAEMQWEDAMRTR